MTRDEARAERTSLRTLRDLGLLFFVAAALVAGLIHYSLARETTESASSVSGARGDVPSGEPASPSAATSSPTAASPSPSAPSTAWTSSSPASPDPTAPSDTLTTTTTDSHSTVTCWNGTTESRLSACGRPTGVAGLRWVFPTLGHRGMSCHRAPQPAGDYGTVVARECFTTVGGQPVTITFEQVASQTQADDAIQLAFHGAEMYPIKGARGGRSTWFDPTSNPARATGYYEGYPYVVSLYAAGGDTAKTAWSSLVGFRNPSQVRGIRS